MLLLSTLVELIPQMAERSEIHQFNGAAYQGWAYKVKYGLIDKDLHTVVFGFGNGARTPCPALITPLTQADLDLIAIDDVNRQMGDNDALVRESQRDYDAWIKMDMKAQAFIVKYLGPSEHTHTRHCTYAYQMWESLKSFYELQGEIEVANAQAQLSAIIMTESESLAVYVRRLQDLHDLLARLEEPVPPTKQATNLLNSLNSRYSTMVETIQTWSQSAPQLYTVQNIVSTLLQRDVREEINARKRGEPLGSGERPQAHFGGAGPSGRNSGSLGGGMKDVQCHNCRKYGHFKSNCPQANPGRLDIKCHKCGQVGHVIRDCKAGNFDKRNAVRCSYCKRPNHSVEECNQHKRDQEGAARLAASSPSEFDASDSLTYSVSSSIFSAGSNLKSPLILDSGATDHIFPSEACFTEYSTEKIPMTSAFIYTADNQPHEVKGNGIVTLLLHQGMEQTTVRLHALHVPTLGQTLLSLNCLNKRGQVEFNLSKNGTPTLTQDGKTWADLKTTRNGLIMLSGHVVMPKKKVSWSDEVPVMGKALSAGRDWHLRLGHPSLTMMNAMSTKGLIPKLTSSESEEVITCQICCQSKMAQTSHKHVDESAKECGKLDRLHLDLVGPMAATSRHGSFNYFQAGIDVGTRLSFVNLLKRKSDALAVSKVAIAALEVESKTNLKSLRTDGGGEYTSAAWQSYVQEKGISHQLTAPYSPQQNGMVERLNRTLLEKMRCLLLWAKLPVTFWDVALLYANFLRNRAPTSALKGGIPIEAWSSKVPNYKKVHTFGCLVQYLKLGHDKNKRSMKYASRTSFGIFLGMPSNQAGFLVFDPQRPGVLVRDDVKFFDDIPGYPRLMDKATRDVEAPKDDDFFTLFPTDDDDAAPAIPVDTPAAVVPPPAAVVPPPAAVPPPVSPIDVVQLSSDTESGAGGEEDEGEVDWVTTETESIADRVSARRRAHLASFGDVL